MHRQAKQRRRVANIEEEEKLLDLQIRGRVDVEDLEDDLDEKPESEAQEIVDLATAASTLAVKLLDTTASGSNPRVSFSPVSASQSDCASG